MSMRVEKENFSWTFECDPEIPIELAFCFSTLVSKRSFDFLSWNVVHVSGSDCSRHVQLIECVAGQNQFLEIRYLNSDNLIRGNISHFEGHDIFALGFDLPISSSSPLL